MEVEREDEGPAPVDEQLSLLVHHQPLDQRKDGIVRGQPVPAAQPVGKRAPLVQLDDPVDQGWMSLAPNPPPPPFK